MVTPITDLELQTTRGVQCRLEYEHGPACGFDRIRLDGALLGLARDAGAHVLTGTVVRTVELPEFWQGAARLSLSASAAAAAEEGPPALVEARVVIGADGPGSIVARAAGVVRHGPRLRRAGITFHRPAPPLAPGLPASGRFVFGHDWYVGIAPVPDNRVNIGMVVPAAILRRPLERTIEDVLDDFPGPAESWMSATTTDHPAVAYPLHHAVTRTAGPGFVLVGDAAGFIDPLTGEGIHRALVSADMAATAVIAALRGDTGALGDYDRHLRARFRSKDAVSWLLQLFFAQPRLFDYALRRLATRRSLRATFTAVLTDQLRASRALDPRFIARLLAP